MSATYLNSLNDQQFRDFLESFDTVLTDCDGVLWIHTHKLPHAPEAMNTFRKLGKRVFYVTNNSTKTRKEMAVKCQEMDFIAEEEDIICTSHLVAVYLEEMNFKKKVYVMGSPAISEELKSVGIESSGHGPDYLNDMSDIPKIEVESGVGAVIIGFDEHFSFPKMVKAATYLRNENVHFIATNTDENFPSKKIVCPGTGCFVSSMETCTGRKATVIGKPEPYMSNMIKKLYKVDPGRTLMIGDRANTDILLGKRCGFKTLLVLTGVSSLKDIENWKKSEIQEEKDWIPDFYTDKLGDLFPMLENCQLEKGN